MAWTWLRLLLTILINLHLHRHTLILFRWLRNYFPKLFISVPRSFTVKRHCLRFFAGRNTTHYRRRIALDWIYLSCSCRFNLLIDILVTKVLNLLFSFFTRILFNDERLIDAVVRIFKMLIVWDTILLRPNKIVCTALPDNVALTVRCKICIDTIKQINLWLLRKWWTFILIWRKHETSADWLIKISQRLLLLVFIVLR